MGDSLDDLMAMRKDPELQAERKAASQEKRARNRERGAERLETEGIAHETKNDGAHLIVSHCGIIVDYWPGTGLWRVRSSGESQRGIGSLVARCRLAERTKS